MDLFRKRFQNFDVRTSTLIAPFRFLSHRRTRSSEGVHRFSLKDDDTIEIDDEENDACFYIITLNYSDDGDFCFMKLFQRLRFHF